jgi:hypothetical protein
MGTKFASVTENACIVAETYVPLSTTSFTVLGLSSYWKGVQYTFAADFSESVTFTTANVDPVATSSIEEIFT